MADRRMDRALKERIVGATVLVIFVVLVVPVFLDGPPQQDAVVAERVRLPGQEDQQTRVVVLDRDRSVAVPATNADAVENDESADTEEAAAPIPQPAPLVARAESQPAPDDTRQSPAEPEAERRQEPAPEAKPESRPEHVIAASGTGMFAVQLGSFRNRDNAEKLAAGLREQGYAAFLSQSPSDAGPMHRVRIGPQKDREGAEAMAARLLKVGHKGQVVPHP